MHQGACTLRLHDMQDFFFPFTSEPQKQAPQHQAQRLSINILSFPFFSLLFNKEKAEPWCLAVKQQTFQKLFLFSWVFDDHEFSHLQPLCLTPGNGSEAAVWRAIEKLAEHSHWPSHSSDCRRLGRLSVALSNTCVCPLPDYTPSLPSMVLLSVGVACRPLHSS